MTWLWILIWKGVWVFGEPGFWIKEGVRNTKQSRYNKVYIIYIVNY